MGHITEYIAGPLLDYGSYGLHSLKERSSVEKEPTSCRIWDRIFSTTTVSEIGCLFKRLRVMDIVVYSVVCMYMGEIILRSNMIYCLYSPS